MEKRKLKLKCVNKGKQFVIPNMTVLAQERYMEELSKLEDSELSDEQRAMKANKIMVLVTLQLVDKTVQMSDIQMMHPMDFTVIFEEINRCFAEGRELSDEDDDKG